MATILHLCVFWDRQCALCTMCNVHCANSGTKAGKWILSKQNIKERKIFPRNVDCQVWRICIMSYSQESCQISQFSMCNSISKKFPFFVYFAWAKLDREVLVTNLTSWLGKVEKLDKLLSIANNFFHQLLIVNNCCHQLSTIVVINFRFLTISRARVREVKWHLYSIIGAR